MSIIDKLQRTIAWEKEKTQVFKQEVNMHETARNYQNNFNHISPIKGSAKKTK